MQPFSKACLSVHVLFSVVQISPSLEMRCTHLPDRVKMGLFQKHHLLRPSCQLGRLGSRSRTNCSRPRQTMTPCRYNHLDCPFLTRPTHGGRIFGGGIVGIARTLS